MARRDLSKKKQWRWIERWSWIAGIIAALIAVVAYFCFRSVNTNISSFNQSGGITAHTVNVGPGKRALNQSVRQQLDAITAGKKKIVVACVMGDSEAFQFANEIADYLKTKGVPVSGVDQVAYTKPVKGQLLNPLPDNELEIVIGSRE